MRTYLLASLPSLSLDAPAPLSEDEFQKRCVAVLPPSEVEELGALCRRPPSGRTMFACAWRGVWNQIRNTNDAERAGHLGEMPSTDPLEVQPFRVSLQDAVEEAWQAPDPLQRERALLQAEWDWLEQQRRAAPFGFPDLAGYGLQLHVLCRKEQWDSEQGKMNFEQHLDFVLNPLIENILVQQEVGQ